MNTQDSIRIKDRLLNVCLSSGSQWSPKNELGTLQPIAVSVQISYDVAPCSVTDNLDLTLNYSSISKELGLVLEKSDPSYRSIEDVMSCALTVVQRALIDVTAADISIKILQLRGPLHCKNVGLEIWSARGKEGWMVSRTRHFVTDFTCPTIIGVNDVERVEEQEVVVNISIETSNFPLDQYALDYRNLTRSLWKVRGILWSLPHIELYGLGNETMLIPDIGVPHELYRQGNTALSFEGIPSRTKAIRYYQSCQTLRSRVRCRSRN